MEKLIHLIITTLSLILTLYSIYYVGYALFAFKREKKYQIHIPNKKFAILIAARNESLVIADLINSLHDQYYPKTLYDIYVIPNNCTDNTAQVAKDAGAIILDCQYPVHSKGEVLRHSFDLLMSSKYDYDAFCVFDADNVVDLNFLQEMNNALNDNVKIAQGYREAKNPYDSWITGSYHIYFMIMNQFINRAKTNAGLSAYLSGTGFMISLDVLKRSNGWRTITLSEDTEYSLISMLADQKIAWVPKAITYDEQPLDLKQSMIQRARWSSGAIQLLVIYYKKLYDRLNLNNFRQLIDGFMSLIAPTIQLLSIIQLLVITIFAYIYNDANLPTLVLPIFMSYVTTTIIAIIVLASQDKLNKHCLLGVFSFWFFVLSWTPLNLISLFKRQTQWYQINHCRSVKSEKLVVRRQDI